MKGKFVITVDADSKSADYAINGSGEDHLNAISNALGAVIMSFDKVAQIVLDRRPDNEEFASLMKGLYELTMESYIEDRQDKE